MLKQLTEAVVGALVNFRQRLYDALVYRADALFNLLDSLSGNTTAQSVVELSLNAPFTRQYSSLHDGVDNLQLRGAKCGDGAHRDGGAAIGLGWVDRGRAAASSRATLLAAGARYHASGETFCRDVGGPRGGLLPEPGTGQ